MAELKVSKFVSSLPATLEASTIYLVKVGAGFDMYVTNQMGTVVAYALNAPASATGVFSGVVNSAATSITLSAAHHGQILVLSANTLVVVSVPASGLPSNFYCRVLSTTSGGFRASAASGVTIGSPMSGLLAVRSRYADADLYAIGGNTYVMKSGYLSQAFTLNAIPVRPLVAVSASRRISEAYVGNLLDVRRSSDNTVLGIGTNGDGLDTAQLSAHVGSGSGWVRTLYDQSGNGFHFSQTDTSRQPRIVDGGTLDQAGGHAAIRALSTGTWLDAGLSVTGTTLTICAVGTMNSATANYGRLMSLGQSGQNDYDNTQYTAAVRREQTDQKLRSDRAGTQYFDAAITYSVPFSYVLRYDGSQVSLFLNGQLIPPQNSNGQFNISTLRLFAAMQLGGEYWDGNFCEGLVFGGALTDAQIGTLYADQKAYYNLP